MYYKSSVIWLLCQLLCRHAHKLFVCGGAGSGKKTLKNNWSMTSWSDVVEKIADVEIITCQVVCVCMHTCVCVLVCVCVCVCVCARMDVLCVCS